MCPKKVEQEGCECNPEHYSTDEEKDAIRHQQWCKNQPPRPTDVVGQLESYKQNGKSGERVDRKLVDVIHSFHPSDVS